jgi:hypothetical protein
MDRLRSVKAPIFALAIVVALLAVVMTTGGAAAHLGEPLAIDQSQNTLQGNINHTDFGQSFTAGVSGDLARINVEMFVWPTYADWPTNSILVWNHGTLRVYEGSISGGG